MHETSGGPNVFCSLLLFKEVKLSRLMPSKSVTRCFIFLATVSLNLFFALAFVDNLYFLQVNWISITNTVFPYII